MILSGAQQDGLIYTEDPHGYLWHGKPVPYTSGILADLGISNDFSKIKADVVRRKGRIGTAFHLAAKYQVLGTLREDSVDARVAPYLAALRAFYADTGAKVIAAEIPLYSVKCGFATTLDAVVELNGRLSIVEYKTSSALDPAVEHQLWFQAVAWDEVLGAGPFNLGIKRRFSLKLDPSGKYGLRPWSVRSPKNALQLLFTWKERRRLGKPCHV